MTQSYFKMQRVEISWPQNPMRFSASNGGFSGFVIASFSDKDLVEMGRRLRAFTGSPGDLFIFKDGGPEWLEPEESYYLYLKIAASDSTGHFHIEFDARRHDSYPHYLGHQCRLSLDADTAAINRLGQLLETFADETYVELHWVPEGGRLFTNDQLQAGDSP